MIEIFFQFLRHLVFEISIFEMITNHLPYKILFLFIVCSTTSYLPLFPINLKTVINITRNRLIKRIEFTN